jgi:hypothetical protein
MKITLTKAGKNVRISFDPTETTQPDMLEDSANVEVTYQNLNNNVTVSIMGGGNFQTGNITTGLFLYMDSGSGPVLINSKALFNTNYALVFPNGGGGPVTTPNIDTVLAQGGSLTATRQINLSGQIFNITDSINNASIIFQYDGAYQSKILSTNGDGSGNLTGFYFNDGKFDTGLNDGLNGLKIDFITKKFFLGDWAGIYNGTKLELDDNNSITKLINNQNSGYTEIATNILRFTGPNLQSNSAGGNSGEHLIIELNGAEYKIKLENP